MEEVFLAELEDPDLRELELHSVESLLGGRVLLVKLWLPDGASPQRVLPALARARGYLRTEVAAAIHRRRTPELSFALLRAGTDPSANHEATG